MKMYYSIASVNELTANEKMILSEIIQLSTVKGCFASNDYFVKKFQISKRTVTNALDQLEKLQYVKRTVLRSEDVFDKKFRMIVILKKTKDLLPKELEIKEIKEISIDSYGEIHTSESDER